MPANNFHNQRLKEVLQREIGVVIAGELRDPRIPDVVTITAMKLATDNRNATVYVSFMGEEHEKSELLDVLNKAAPFIQRTVASRVTMKHFPRLLFKLDNSLEHSRHINELLKEVQDDLE